MNPFLKFTLFLIISLIFTTLTSINAQHLPPGFQENFISSWIAPTCLQFDKNGGMYVCERSGKVFKYENGVKTLIIDISEEVANYGDSGLISILLDPNFESNGYIYLGYVVDRHYLLYFGTPAYDPNVTSQDATICRVTRYKLNQAENYLSVLPHSRLILLGQLKTNGIPMTASFHAGLGMVFGSDGSLMVTAGDGCYGSDYEDQAFADNILTQQEYDQRREPRCQLLTSLNGKLLRIDPQTGFGIPSNPYFEYANPNSAKSKIWSIGIRNSFRISLKPNTGSHVITDGNPGQFYLNDVGSDQFEEINLVNAPALNFGWPGYEGMFLVRFSNTSPFAYTKPLFDWNRLGAPARITKNGQIVNIGSGDFPFPSFNGNCPVGGTFYEGKKFPEAYHNTYFFADYGQGWIEGITFDGNNEPISKPPKLSGYSPSIVYLKYNPNDEAIYSINVLGQISKIEYNPTGVQPPTADFEISKNYGPSPLNVSFDASITSNPANSTLTYLWDFGNGNTANTKIASQTFTTATNAPTKYVVKLTVTDAQNNSNSISKIVSANNTKPVIVSTNLDNVDFFKPDGTQTLNLGAVVIDNEENANQLGYEWSIILHHDTHLHTEFTSNTNGGAYTLAIIPCDFNLYFYEVRLKVTDSYGLSTIYTKNLYPKCNQADSEAPSLPTLAVENIANNKFKLVWRDLTDNLALKNIEVFLNNKQVNFNNGQSNEFYYQGNNMLNSLNKANIIVRDFGANTRKSGNIYFSVPTNICTNTNCDITAPTTPIWITTGTTFQNNNQAKISSNVSLSWQASSDIIDSQVTYEIWMNGLLQGTVTNLYIDVQNVPNGTNEFTIQAVDDAGNKSASKPIYFTNTTALPLNLISFTGDLNGNKHILNWQTTYESDIEAFEIEKSYNGLKFEKIAYINGKNSELNNYKFENEGSISTYYRLKILSRTAKSYYSNLIYILANDDKEFGEFFPNPTSQNEITLLISKKCEGIWNTKFMTITGQLLKKEDISLLEGNNLIKLNFEFQTQPIILVEFQKENKTIIRKFYVK